MSDACRRPSSRAEFRCALIELVAHRLSSRRRRSEPVRVDGDTPLFETGLVDSMAILELIAFVEEATGQSIPARQVHLKKFGTVDRICDAFWADGDPDTRDSGSPVARPSAVAEATADRHSLGDGGQAGRVGGAHG
jgi:acyl carrier protein